MHKHLDRVAISDRVTLVS